VSVYWKLKVVCLKKVYACKSDIYIIAKLIDHFQID